MEDRAIVLTGGQLAISLGGRIPRLLVDAGDQSCRRFIEFFTANIQNRNTREDRTPEQCLNSPSGASAGSSP
jgi:hypothetical protein